MMAGACFVIARSACDAAIQGARTVQRPRGGSQRRRMARPGQRQHKLVGKGP